MQQYSKLDKELKDIRNNKEYDLYEINLESQKRIEQFYKDEEIPENDMMKRKYNLESYLERRNALFIPVIITIIWGLLVNIVFKSFETLPNFIYIHQQLKTIPVKPENLNQIMIIYILLIIMVVFVGIVFAIVFAMPFPYLSLLFGFNNNNIYQIKYELDVLDDIINKKLRENKNGKPYIHNCKNKFLTRKKVFVITVIIIGIYIGYSWKIPLYKNIILIVIGTIIGVCFKK